MESTESKTLSPELLQILCCPVCKLDLVYDQKQSTLTCTGCGRVYEVKDGIPIMIADHKDESHG